MSLIPLLRLYVNFDLNGTFPAIWLAHTGFGLPLAIYLLRNYIGSLPSSMMESARIDGASHFDIFTKLVVPLSVPVLASFAIFQFLWVWNDLLVSLVFLGTNPDIAVLTVSLAQLVGSRGQAWHLLTAGAFVSMIIPLIVFLTLQRFFVRGILAGSVKG
jgi:alpha-glucoside transport system permease protein